MRVRTTRMLYDSRTNTLIETNVTGEISEAELQRLAAAKGSATRDGQPIEQVAIVFAMPGHAEKNVALIKRFGLECRGFDETGMEKVHCTGTRVRSASEAPTGPLVPVLREESWPHIDTVVHRRLLSGPHPMGPFLTFGFDQGNTIARLAQRDLGGRTLGDVEGEALANIASRPRDKKKVSENTIAIFDEYGSEAILLRPFMRELEAELGGGPIVVAVPREGGFMAVPGTAMREISALVGWARQNFDEAQGRRVSPIPFLVSDGDVVGFVSLTPEGASEPPSKPWWRFW